jgi:hypothetical protein
MFMFHTLLAGKTVQVEPGTGAARATEVADGAAPNTAGSQARTTNQRERLMVMAIGIPRRYG